MASNLATIRVELIANAQKFKSNIDKASTSMKKVDKSAKKTQTRMKGVSKAFQNTAGSIAAVQGPLGPLAGRLSSIGAIIGRVSIGYLALAAAGVAVGLAFTKLIKNTAAVQTQMLKLEAILKATGGAAGLSLQEVESLSREIGIATLASVAKVRDAAGILLTFKSITGDVFRDALRLAQDLAEVGFGDLKMGATQLGKALEDPIVGLGALRRVGVSFTEAQKEMIKVLVMTGKKAEAQRIILDALDQQVGGAGVKAATGLAGAIDSLKENLDIFFETTKAGVGIVNFFTKTINKLADAMARANVDASTLKTQDQVNDKLKQYKEELEAINELTLAQKAMMLLMLGQSVDLRAKDLKLLIKELDIQGKVLKTEENRKKFARPTMADMSGPITQETILGKIRQKNDRDHERSTNRAIEDLGKTQTELKNLNDLRKIEDALRKKIGSDGEAAEEAVANQMKKATEDILARNAVLDEMAKKQKELNDLATGTGTIFAGVGDKINDAMMRGKLATLDFKSILLEMVIALQKMIFKVMVLDKIQQGIEDRMKKGGFDIGGIIKGAVGIFTGGKAGGGTTQQGQPTLVGERGPELFVPNSAGSIKNNSDTKSAMGGGGGVSIV